MVASLTKIRIDNNKNSNLIRRSQRYAGVTNDSRAFQSTMDHGTFVQLCDVPKQNQMTSPKLFGTLGGPNKQGMALQGMAQLNTVSGSGPLYGDNIRRTKDKMASRESIGTMSITGSFDSNRIIQDLAGEWDLQPVIRKFNDILQDKWERKEHKTRGSS
jgi:hypothetical protein